jgi:hypothetical protein
MSDVALPIVVAEWKRNGREVIRVSLGKYQSNHTIDVRVADWWMNRWPQYGRFFETRDRHSVDDEADETREIGGAA